MSNFISVYTGLPAINHLCKCKERSGRIGEARLIMDVNKPILLWDRAENNTLMPPILVESWKYVEDNKDNRQKEANAWIESFHSEVELFSKYGLEPLNIVDIEEALSGKYDVLLLDEITHLPDEYIESLIKHIENTSVSKIVAVCNGYRRYFPITKLEGIMYKGSLNPNNNSKVVFKCYEDMPLGFFDLNNIEEAKKMFDYPEEFNMEYKGHII
ncbi:hypothetical protein KAU51_04590 [Candidatus Parcubacteria bacterium]|nr:hypothetical protein [Candidatus Parcubacteria bacterium]